MAILGLGTDIVEVARIEKLLKDKREEFLARVFTPTEIEYCHGKARPQIHFAARFAAKEAFMKAIGTGWAKGVGFNQIGVCNNEDGKPTLKITGEAKAVLDGLGPSFLWISISHAREYATATVVIETRT
jgi:holo-[acyl-carrier protein] synthase